MKQEEQTYSPEIKTAPQRNFNTWAPSAPYSCSIYPDPEHLPEKGDRAIQMQSVQASVDLVEARLRELGVKTKDIEWISMQLFSRFSARIEQNDSNFLCRDTAADHFPELQALLEKANKGLATMPQLLDIRIYTDMKSIELGRVSAPSCGTRSQLVDLMLAEAISLVGDSISDEPEVTEFAWTDNGDETTIRGVMTIAKNIGTMSDGTVIAMRTSYAVVLKQARPLSFIKTVTSLSQLDISLSEQLAVTTFAYNNDSARRQKERIHQTPQLRAMR